MPLIIESYYIGILANLTFRIGEHYVKSILNEKSIHEEIKSAYRKTTKKFTVHNWDREGIKKEFERHIKEILKEELVEVELNPKEKEFNRFIGIFKEELTKKVLFSRYIQQEQNKAILRGLFNLEERLQSMQMVDPMQFLHTKEWLKYWNIDEKKINELYEFIRSRCTENPEKIHSKWIKDVRKNTLDFLLNYELDDRLSKDIGQSALNTAFSDFLTQELWNERMQDRIEKLHGAVTKNDINIAQPITDLLKRKQLFEGSYNRLNNELKKAINEFESQTDIRKVVTDYRGSANPELEKEVRNIIDTVHWLKTEVHRPSYSKVFLVTGSSGSGKTHFIAKNLREGVRVEKMTIPIYINVGISESISVKSLIADYINSFFEKDYSLGELLTLLAEDEIFGKHNYLIVIDECEFMDRKNLDMLCATIDNSTHQGNIYWLLSINYNFLDKVLTRSSFFNEYGFKFIEHELLEKDTSEKQISSSLFQINSWFDLDSINRIERCSKRILTENLDELYLSDESMIKYETRLSPLLAWIVVENIKDSNSPQLNYLQVVKELSIKLEQKTKLESVYLIGDFVDATCNEIITGKKFTFNELTLKKSIKDRLVGKSKLQDDQVLSSVFKSFLRINLLYREVDFDIAKLNKSTDVSIYLRNLIYWKYQLALYLLSDGYEDAIRMLSRQDEHQKDIWNHVFQFVLIAFDSSGKSKKDFIGLIEQILQGKILSKKSLWLAMLSIDDHYCEIITKEINSRTGKKAKNKLMLYENKNDLFALLSLFARYERSDLSISKRLSILNSRNVITSIIEYDYRGLYQNTLLKIFERIESPKDLVDTLQNLTNIHELGIAKEVAIHFVNHLFEIRLNDDLSNLTVLIFKYINNNAKQFKKKRNKENKWVRTHFIEWVLHYLAIGIVNRMGFSSYYFFMKNGWYDEGLEFDLFDLLSGEANIAISRLKKNRVHFENFLDDLIKNGKKIDKKNCFFIIRHTTETRMGEDAIVHPAFQKILLKVAKDEELEDLVEKFRRFFASNLNHSL